VCRNASRWKGGTARCVSGGKRPRRLILPDVEIGMIQVTPQMGILAVVQAVDFRNGIDGLARVCKPDP
jgi:hypothetical protein